MKAHADQLRNSPLAIEVDAANRQHYEVPPEFFAHVLGPRLKYSSCYYSSGLESLPAAEEAMLRLTCERAGIVDGMQLLDLGCGWGSLSLWIATKYSNCKVTAVSNSSGQRKFIERQAKQLGVDHQLQVITADMRTFDTQQFYDRILSVEMFEHLRNYQVLFDRLAKWLTSDGKVFAHVFCHRNTPYLFETNGTANWMGQNFFTGGQMPSYDLFGCFTRALTVEQQWTVNGLHYWQTCESWLSNLDANRSTLLALLRRELSPSEARQTLQRWRMFLMACAELFRYNQGTEWFVAHYLFAPSQRTVPGRLSPAGVDRALPGATA